MWTSVMNVQANDVIGRMPSGRTVYCFWRVVKINRQTIKIRLYLSEKITASEYIISDKQTPWMSSRGFNLPRYDVMCVVFRDLPLDHVSHVIRIPELGYTDTPRVCLFLPPKIVRNNKKLVVTHVKNVITASGSVNALFRIHDRYRSQYNNPDFTLTYALDKKGVTDALTDVLIESLAGIVISFMA